MSTYEWLVVSLNVKLNHQLLLNTFGEYATVVSANLMLDIS